MAADTPVSIWEKTAQEPDFRAPLTGPSDADVVIVGGGYTGLSTALHCAERGLRAHVIEAENIGYGGSGRNVGLVNAGVWLPPAAVRKKLGDLYGPRFVTCFGDAPSKVFDLIEKHQIRCALTKTGTIHAAHAPSGLKNLRSRFDDWERLGAPVALLSATEMEEQTGTKAFCGGLLDRRAGTVNPMAYCRGMARAALGAGATISSGVSATRLLRDGQKWIVESDQGPLQARHVVLATNAYSDQLWPGLKGAFTPISYFQLATKPLSAEMSHILPGGQGLWDTGKIMFSLRRDNENRIVIGSMGTVVGSAEHGVSYRWAQKRLARLFPELGPVDFEDAWHGKIAMTPDHLPRIIELAPSLYTAVGYNGRGITTGTIFGEYLAKLITGMDPADLPLPMTNLSKVPSAAVVSRLYQTAFTANQVVKGL